jgi:amidohydrolase
MVLPESCFRALALLLASAAAPALWAAPPPNAADAKLKAAVERLAPAAIEARHRIHQNPELGNREFKTAELVAERLRSLGLDVSTGVAHTGVVGLLKGGRPGPLVAVRADMDALPVTEDTPLPFKSTVKADYRGQQVGVMHACGHDVHVAVQLGVASVLASLRAQLPGSVQFIFQPAEEGPPPGEEGGAALMLKEGIWAQAKPQAVFGLHASGNDPVGRIGYRPGAMMAAADTVRIVIKGKQAHGARPELAVDPVVMAAQVVLALQTIHSRNVPPLQPSVVTIGIIRGGQRENIIPAEVELAGTVRSYDAGVQDLIERRMREILDGITKAGGGSYSLDYDRGYPTTTNDPALTAASLPSLERVVGKDNLRLVDPMTPSEDFSYFANQTPGFFFQLGTEAAGAPSGDHHTPTFLADDSAIPVGMRAMSTLLLDYLTREASRRE